MPSRITRMFTPISAAVLCGLGALPADADLSISGGTTSNVSCSQGTCTATARDAVLNVDDLTGLLGAGDLKVITGGGAQDLRVDSSFGWSNARVLTLDAARSVMVDHRVQIKGGWWSPNHRERRWIQRAVVLRSKGAHRLCKSLESTRD